MTVLVGVKCSDGVVIGADSAATTGAGQVHLLKMATDKISIVDGRVIVAGTGQMGLGQRFNEVVAQAHRSKEFQKTTVELSKFLAAGGITDFRSTAAPAGEFGALVAAPIEDRGQLIEFAVADFQPEIKTQKLNFVAMGSGQTLAEPFVSFVHRTFWDSSTPDVRSAVFGVYWALRHTILCAPGFVGDPIAIATLTKSKGGWAARLIPDEELDEQRQHIEELEKNIRNYRTELLQEVGAEKPPVPPG